MAGVDYAAGTARLLLGATAHPGGTALTRHLLDVAGLAPGSFVLDLACGGGTTLGLLDAAGHAAVGVDVEPRAVARARRRAPAVVADAHHLPLPDGTFDAVICECSVSTFTSAPAALAEVARVLRPGGAFAMTDVVLDRDRAPAAVVAAVDRLTTAQADSHSST
jgi:ubiquinone/menaquinone biosynthesis C-methylase UbiE